jgi:hypothetical protein
MKLVKGVVFVVGVVVVALGVFNGLVVVVSAYFGPFYQGDADQSRNFGLWLVGNGLWFWEQRSVGRFGIAGV